MNKKLNRRLGISCSTMTACGTETLPFEPEDIRLARARGRMSRYGGLVGCYKSAVAGAASTADAGQRVSPESMWIMELQTLIQAHPTFGHRRL
jgi:hypothetical protein